MNIRIHILKKKNCSTAVYSAEEAFDQGHKARRLLWLHYQKNTRDVLYIVVGLLFLNWKFLVMDNLQKR